MGRAPHAEIPGEAGRDALAGLGLSARLQAADQKKTFGVNLPATLDLSSADAIAKAKEQVGLQGSARHL